MRARMNAIQENEIAQLRDLTGFLNLEFQFIESYLEVLKSVKDEWVDEYVQPSRTYLTILISCCGSQGDY